ncbi:MAG: hypothetical protein EPN23_03295 [Verrucomicrobia bacterium]|nr:MAG: hypothetical protein EPN23_03295 [Verrucomicrobiota bacterium]
MKLWRMMWVMSGVLGLAVGGLRAQTSAVEGAVSPAPEGPRSSAGAVEQWLKHLQARNPAEYERLTQLREEDPAAFQKAMKDRLERIRSNKAGALSLDVGKAASPRIHEPGAGKSREQRTDDNKYEQEIRELAASYKTATPEDKKKLQAELKKHINESFDWREKTRQEMIQRIENQLTHLKKDAEQSKANRDTIVERRLKELTEGNPSAK